MTVRADLHNHSCLSPCGDLDNSPLALARIAAERGIAMLALTDHNSAANCPAFAAACDRYNITPIFGTETTSAEEIHILSLYGDLASALSWSAWVYERLPDFKHSQENFGEQLVVDVDETILSIEERYLIPGISATLDEIATETLRRGGLVIPAHIDRSAHSIASQIGFLPNTRFSALEITQVPVTMDLRGHRCITSSDAHRPEEIGRRWISFETPGPPMFADLVQALQENRVSLSIG
jgi:PHP family Zn ribbon phosphoesterase